MKNKVQWKHVSKFKNKLFVGSYERDNAGERVFILSSASRRITFESYQMAKKVGWIKL